MTALLGIAGPQVVGLVVGGNLLALGIIFFILPKQVDYHRHSENKKFSVLGFIQVAPALCMGIIFFSFFDGMVLSMFPVYAADHGYTIKIAALMVTVILLGDAALQFPLGWLSDNVPRPVIYLGCGLLSLAIGGCLPWLMNFSLLLWPSLILLGAAAGGVYTLAIIMIGEGFSGPDLVTANASAGFLWGIGSLLGPLLSSAAMTTGAYGLPLALTGAAALFVSFALLLFKKSVTLKALS
jgi:MFS family permease